MPIGPQLPLSTPGVGGSQVGRFPYYLCVCEYGLMQKFHIVNYFILTFMCELIVNKYGTVSFSWGLIKNSVCVSLAPNMYTAKYNTIQQARLSVSACSFGCTGGAVVRGSDWQSQDREFKPHWR